jgi:hypothetical protein
MPDAARWFFPDRILDKGTRSAWLCEEEVSRGVSGQACAIAAVELIEAGHMALEPGGHGLLARLGRLEATQAPVGRFIGNIPQELIGDEFGKERGSRILAGEIELLGGLHHAAGRESRKRVVSVPSGVHGKQRLRQQPLLVRGGEAGKARSSLVNSDKVERDLAFVYAVGQ